MTYKEEITKLIRASYDQGAKDAQQETLAALEQIVAAARAAEREACAQFCETNQVWVGQGKRGFIEWSEEDFATGGRHQGMDYASAIRARGQA